jgi:uncharacterized protein (DUF1778 family)
MNPDPPDARRRAYVFPGRHKRLFARFTDDEYAEVTTAAGRYGLTPSGFCSQAALDAARNVPTGTTAERLEHEALANLQAELFQARVTLNQLRAEPTSPATTSEPRRTISTRPSTAPPTRSPTSTAPQPASTDGSAQQDQPDPTPQAPR